MHYSKSSLFGNCFKGLLDQAKQLDPDNIFKVLVYAAAEAGAMRLIQTIFSLPAGRIAFEAYKEDSSLPEDIAEENGHGKVAAYLRDITRRLVDDLCTIQSLIASVFLAWINIDVAFRMPDNLCNENARTDIDIDTKQNTVFHFIHSRKREQKQYISEEKFRKSFFVSKITNKYV